MCIRMSAARKRCGVLSKPTSKRPADVAGLIRFPISQDMLAATVECCSGVLAWLRQLCPEASASLLCFSALYFAEASA